MRHVDADTTRYLIRLFIRFKSEREPEAIIAGVAAYGAAGRSKDTLPD
jgi:hypothetical protein